MYSVFGRYSGGIDRYSGGIGRYSGGINVLYIYNVCCFVFGIREATACDMLAPRLRSSYSDGKWHPHHSSVAPKNRYGASHLTHWL